MFGSSNNSNWVNLINPNSQPSPPLPLPPPPPASTSHPFPHFNYSQQDPPSNHFLPSNHETLIDNNYLGFLENGPTLGVLSSSSSPLPSVAKFARKDRHSKICTAQGVRDRRVRLSIGIAREFFDLQDMLGYDKASNTLEWLLNKSKKAIREIARAKRQQETARSAFPAGCHMAMPEEADRSRGPSSDLANFKEIQMKEMPPQAVPNVDQLILGKEEAWTKARARASDSAAREKICCFASPHVVGMHHQQSTRVQSGSSSRMVVKPCQYQRLPLSATPYDLNPLNTEFQNDFPLNDLPPNWDINYNSMILQQSSFSLKDPGPYT